jgi:urea transport system permease protein
MAHGEMLMLGGYLAYLALAVVPGPLGILVAMPTAFIGAAIIGALLEWSIIQRLSSRPLDTLLATWGVSLIMQQAARNLFGAIGVQVVAPGWLEHAVVISSGPFSGLTLPFARLFILAVAVITLGAIALLLNKTRLGLYVRAVNQDRPIAAAMGVNARLVDLCVFSLGTGVAGLAGVILALLGPVTPTVGQSYIVPAFLVVILGGLGSLVGTTIASLIAGLFTAFIEIFVDVSLAQVLLLLFVIAFIQFRPQGVISVRSRALEG